MFRYVGQSGSGPLMSNVRQHTEARRYSTSMHGTIILLNGASSSGKSTLAKALQARIETPFWHFSIDHLLAAGILPQERTDSGEFSWSASRESFFDGFHRSIPALAEAGNNLIVEHIVETEAWMLKLLKLLAHLDVFFVGVHCPLPELERRERERGNRRIGEARIDFATTHTFGIYDFEVLSTNFEAANVSALLAAWKSRRHPSAFDKMREQNAGHESAA
jgi:chloramphenicol 3-O phosphotransferase